VLRDCADDEVLSRTYTQKEYRDALSQLATDSSEYSDCESVIRRAQLQQAAGNRRARDAGDESGGGGTTGTPGGGSSSGGSGSQGSSSGGGDVPQASPRPRGSDPLAALSPEERLALDEARTGGGKGIEGTDRVVPPGTGRAPNITGSSDLPGPVLGLLILLAGALVIVTGARLRTRVLGRRAA
jgi:hypothetical protein